MEMLKNLVTTFQTRLPSGIYKPLPGAGNTGKIIESLKADSQLTKFFQDADRDNVDFAVNEGGWNCTINLEMAGND